MTDIFGVAGTSVTSGATTVTTASTANNTDPVNQSIYGKTIPLLFGATKVLCAPLWASALTDTGDDTGDRFITAFWMIGTRGPLTQRVKLHQVWMDNVTVFDATSGTVASLDYTLYDGTASQGAPPEIIADQGSDKVPGFRGRMCIMVRNYRIAVGNAFPECTVLVEQSVEQDIRYVTPYLTAPAVPAGAYESGWNKEAGVFYVTDYANELLVFDPLSGTLLAHNVLQHASDYILFGRNVQRGPGALDPSGMTYICGFGLNFNTTQLRQYHLYTGTLLSAYGYDRGDDIVGGAHTVDYGHADDISVGYIEYMDVAPGTYNTADFWVMTATIFGNIQVFKKNVNGGRLALVQTWGDDYTGFSLTNHGNFLKCLDLTDIAPQRNVVIGYAVNNGTIIQITQLDGSTVPSTGADAFSIFGPTDATGSTSAVVPQATVDLTSPGVVTFAQGATSGSGFGGGLTKPMSGNAALQGELYYDTIATGANGYTYGALIGYKVQKYTTLRAYSSVFKVFDIANYPYSSTANEVIMGIWLSPDGSQATILVSTNEGAAHNLRLLFCKTVFTALTKPRYNNDAGNLSNGYGGLPSPMTDAGGLNYGTNSQFVVERQVLLPGGTPDVQALRQIPKGQSKFVYGKDTSTGHAFEFVVVNLLDGSYVTYVFGTYKNVATGLVYDPPGLNAAGAFYDSEANLFYYKQGLPDYPGVIALDASPTPQASMELSTLVTSLGILAGFEQSEITSTHLDTVNLVGSVINVQVDFLTLAGQLASLFCVDIVESEGKLKFNGPAKGTAFTLARTLTDLNLAPPDQFSSDDGALFDKARAATASLPTILTVDYLDSDNDYQVGSQTARRTQYPYKTSAGLAVPVVSVPVAMSAVTALYWVSFALFEEWAGALTLTGLFARDQLALEPGDYIEIVTEYDGTFIVKLTAITLNQDWSMSFTATTVAQEAPSANVVNDPTAIIVGSTGAIAQPYNVAYIENINILPYSSDDNINDCFISVVSDAPIDAYVFLPDGTYVLNAVDGGSVFGYIQNAHPSLINYESSDDITPITVKFSSASGFPQLTVDDLTYLSGGGAAIIGAPGRWELIYYRTVFAVTAGVFTFSHIARGRRGSDYDGAMLAGKSGDQFIALTSASSISHSPIAVNGVTLPIVLTCQSQVKGATTKLRTSSVTVTGGSLKPWAPAEIKAIPTGSDIVITWERRDRSEIDLLDTGDDSMAVPMSEATEAYEVDILSANGSTVLRTYHSLTSPSCTYLAADIATDGMSGAIILNVAVYQMSAVVGRGYTRKTACPLT